MDQRDRAAIEGLFERIARVAQRSGPRDRGADAFINSQIAVQPEAPYYMAQTIIAQEQALNAAQERIEELEQRLQGGGRSEGLFGGLFGSRETDSRTRYADARREMSPWGAGPGGGFLAGAAQTAMGVAGGVLLGHMLADWLSPDHASAQELDAGTDLSDSAHDVGNVEVADAGGFGDFDLGDF